MQSLILNPCFITAHDQTGQGNNAPSAQAPAPVTQQPVIVLPQILQPAPPPDEVAKLKEEKAKLEAELAAIKKKSKDGKKEEPVVNTNTNMDSKDMTEFRKLLEEQQKAVKEAQEANMKAMNGIVIQQLTAELDRVTKGEYDPKYLDTSSPEAFKNSVPLAMKAYSDAKAFFFTQFAEEAKLNLRSQVVNPQSQQRQMLGNMPNPPMQQVNFTQQQQAPQTTFQHPMIDGGRSYAAVRASLMGANLVSQNPAVAAYQQQMMQPQQPQNPYAGQGITNPNQLQYHNQQQLLMQQQQQQMALQQQQALAANMAPIPDQGTFNGGSMRALQPMETQAAMMAAQNSILTKRKSPGRLAAGVMQGENATTLMRTPIDGSAMGAAPNLDYAYSKAVQDPRAPQNLVMNQ